MNTLRKPLIALCAVTSLVSVATYASIPASVTPVFGTAVVDGDYSEWNLATDFAAEMREAGKASFTLLSKLYLRYDCNTDTMYVLVLREGTYEAKNSPSDAWIKFDSLPGNGKVVDGNSGDNGTPPDFAWISAGSKFIGYEASFIIEPGTYTEDMEVHIQIKPDRTSSTGKGGQGGTMKNLTLVVPADCPADSDGDGIDDTTDNCPAVANPDQTDTDDDGMGDACDTDDDNDGELDGTDNCPLMPNADQTNTDGDSMGDACDSDDDGDGVDDALDNCALISNPDQADGDSDGIGDACDSPIDTDGDGVPDAADNCPAMPNADQADADSDGMGDACDGDKDGDGVDNGDDNCPLMPNANQTDTDDDDVGDACDADDDGDGIDDALDNCSLMPNADQANADSDSQGDACDGDDDNDGVDDALDNCPLMPNADQADADGDGQGDVCDGDMDGDDVPDTSDNCPVVANPNQTNSDDDEMGDACDSDDDNDGIDDALDNCPTKPNQGQEDADNDGIGNACDNPDAVDLLSFSAKATSNGTAVEWTTASEQDIIAFNLYKGISKVGGCSSNNPDDYDSLTKLSTVNSGQSAYQVDDNFTAVANTTYCYGLVSINDNGDIVDILGATPRQ